MRGMQFRFNGMAAVFAAALVFVLAAGLGSAVLAPAPTVVATVDIERLFNNLDMKKAREDEQKILKESLFAEEEKMQRELELLEADLDALPLGTPQYRQTEEAFVQLGFRIVAHNKFISDKLELRQSQSFRSIYLAIRDASTRLADQHGYDLVLVDDTKVVMPKAGRLQDMNREISARRMLHVNDKIDITDDLLEMMNAEFAAN